MTDRLAWIGPAEARQMIQRMAAIAEPDRLALIAGCAAKCPPGKNKQHTSDTELRRAA